MKVKLKKLLSDVYCACINFVSAFIILSVYFLKIVFSIVKILLTKNR